VAEAATDVSKLHLDSRPRIQLIDSKWDNSGKFIQAVNAQNSGK
jgi:hypothetical protein